VNFIHLNEAYEQASIRFYVITAVAFVFLLLSLERRTAIILWLCRVFCDHEMDWNDDESALVCDICGHEEWMG